MTSSPPALTDDRVALAAAVDIDPVLFSAAILGHDHWHTPQAIMQAIAQPRARVVVPACHASSKSFTAGDIVTWWVTTGGLCVTTAPTWNQVQDVLWPEIRRAVLGARYPLGIDLLQTEARTSKGGYALGISTDQAVRFQGFHAAKVLLVFDEAVGIRPDIWEAAEGISASGDVRWLVLGNPTSRGNKFEELTTAPGVTCFPIDAFDTPNLAGLTLADLLGLDDDELDRNQRPYLVTRRWVKERYLEWGEDDAQWQARVRGQFPAQGEDALISMRWIADAHRRVLLDDPSWVLQAGLDVAGPGEDESVLTLRRGPKLVQQWAWHEADTLRLLGNIRHTLQPYASNLTALVVDAIGIGYHLGGALTQDYGQRVVLLNVAVPSRFDQRYHDTKAELYWGLRERFETGDIGGPMDGLTQAQLASIRFYFDIRGRIRIESKDDARKRGVKSPDRAEAMMLAFAPVAERVRPQAYEMSWR